METMGCEEHSLSLPKGGRSTLFNQHLGKMWGLDINNLFLPPSLVVAQARMLPEAAERLSPAWQVVLAYSEVLQNWVQERSGRCLSGVGEKPALLERFDCCCLSHQFEVDMATWEGTLPTRTLFFLPSQRFDAQE